MKIYPILLVGTGAALLLGRKSSAVKSSEKLPMPPPSDVSVIKGDPYVRSPGSSTAPPVPGDVQTQTSPQAPPQTPQAPQNQQSWPNGGGGGPTWWDPYGGFGQQPPQQQGGEQGPPPNEPSPGSSDPSEWGSLNFNAYCLFMKNWPAGNITMEMKILELINANRIKGGSCGGAKFSSTHKLTLNAFLTCSARAHAKDMWVRKFYDNPDSHKSKYGTAHTNPSGVTSAMRMMQSSYKPSYTMEDIGYGHRTPEGMVNGGQQGPGWMQSPSHCKAVLSPNVYDVGVGFYQEGNSTPMWVVDFAAPQ